MAAATVFGSVLSVCLLSFALMATGSPSFLLYGALGLSVLAAGFSGRALMRRIAALEDMEQSVQSNTAEMRHRARHDPLTGAGNRPLLAERFDQALARAERGCARPSLLFVDLDAFRSVNDSLGHSRGDALLTVVADRLRGCVRSGETVARVGGDEFALLVEWPEGQDRSTGCAIVAERVLDAFSVPFEVSGRRLAISASIGIAHARPGIPLDRLLRDAHFAMYASKARGHGGYNFFHPDLHHQGADRLELVAELRHAVADESFAVYYQPIFDLQTGGLAAVEALVRWEHPERGIVAPADFIPLAEETGLIVPLGRSVLMEACTQAVTWSAQSPEHPPLVVGVNLSPRQFLDPGLIEDVCAALSESGLPAERLSLEITETAMISDIDAATRKLRRLRQLGVWIALDDFGTGHSSLSHLRSLPVTHLKIARPFVERMETDSKDLALVRGIIAMTHGLDQRVIAEGVETAGQRELLRSLGCDLGQGYLYSRPMPAHELGAALAESAMPGRTAPRQVVRSLGHARLISHLPDLTIMLFDRDMRFVAADGSALERLGWPRSELEGKLVREVLPADGAKGLELILEAVLSGTRRSFEWDTLDVEAEPIRDGVDEITGAVLVAREATQPSPVPEAVAGRL